jgi:hypothetical protein
MPVLAVTAPRHQADADRLGVAMQDFAVPLDVLLVLLVGTRGWLQEIRELEGDPQPVAWNQVVVDLSAVPPPLVEGRPCWPLVAVASWITAARAVGIEAVDHTYQAIDSCRDGDDGYAGTVQVGRELLDLWVDERCLLRVVTDGRYLS